MFDSGSMIRFVIGIAFLLACGSVEAPTSNITISSTAVEFGPRNIHDADQMETIVIRNDGNADHALPSITLSGDSQFSIEANTCGSSIDVAQSCDLTVKFAPEMIGSVSATIQVGDDTVIVSGAGGALIVSSINDPGELTQDIECNQPDSGRINCPPLLATRNSFSVVAVGNFEDWGASSQNQGSPLCTTSTTCSFELNSLQDLLDGTLEKITLTAYFREVQ